MTRRRLVFYNSKFTTGFYHWCRLRTPAVMGVALKPCEGKVHPPRYLVSLSKSPVRHRRCRGMNLPMPFKVTDKVVSAPVV